MSSYGMVVAIGSIGALFIVGGCSYKCIQWYQGRGFKYRIKGVKEWIEKVKLGAAKIILPKGHNIEVIGDGTEEEKGANMSYRRKRKAFNEKVGNRVVGNDKGSSQGSIASIVEGEADNVTGDGVQSRLLEGTSTAWQSMLQRRLMDDAMDVVKAREAERKARAVLEDIRIRWDELINGCSSSLSLANIAYTTLPDKGDICGVLPEGGEESFILCQVEDKVEEQQQCLMVALGGDDRRAAWVHMEGLCQIPTPIKATARALLRDMEKASDDLKAQVSITEDAMGKAASAQESLIAALEEEQQKKREPEEEGIAVEQSTMEEARPHQQQQAALDYWHPSLPPLPPALPKEPGDEDEGIDYSNKDINGGKSGMDYPSIHSSEARLHILGESTSNISMSSPVKEASKPREDDKGVPSGMPDLGLLKSWGTGHMAEEGKEKRKSGYRRGEVSRATVTIREKVVYNSSGEQQQEGSGNSYNDKYYDNIKEDYDRIDNSKIRQEEKKKKEEEEADKWAEYAEAQRAYYQQWEQYMRQRQEEYRKAQEQQQQHYYTAMMMPPGSMPFNVQQKRSLVRTPSTAFPPPPDIVSEYMAVPRDDDDWCNKASYDMKVEVLKGMQGSLFAGEGIANRKTAFKQLTMRWHPDKNPDNTQVAKKVFQFLQVLKPWYLTEDTCTISAAAAEARGSVHHPPHSHPTGYYYYH